MAPQQQARYQQTMWHVEMAKAWAAVCGVRDPQARIALAHLLQLVAALGGAPVGFGRPAAATVPLSGSPVPR